MKVTNRAGFHTPLDGLDELMALAPVPIDSSPHTDELTLRELWTLLKRSFRYILPEWRHLLGYALLAAVAGLIQLGGAFFTTDMLMNKVFLAHPLDPEQATLLGLDPAAFVDVTTLSEPSRIELRNIVLSVGAVLFAIAIVVGSTLAYYLVWIMQRINQRLRIDMVGRLEAMSLAYHARAQIGDAIYRVYQDSAMVTNVIENMIVRPAVAFVTLVSNVLVISLFSPVLGLICLLGALPIVVTLFVYGPRVRRRSLTARAKSGELMSGIQESFAGIRVIKAYGLERPQLHQFQRQSEAALHAAFELRRTLAFMRMLVLFVIAGAVLVAEYLMAHYVLAHAPTFGAGLFVFVSFAVWNFGAFTAVRDRTFEASTDAQALVALWGVVQDMAMGLRRALEVLDLEPDIVDSPNARELTLGDGIRFEHVSFSYDGVRRTLSDVNLHVRPGSIVAIVGPTGAGKTTLVSLLLRLFDPVSGRVTIGGTDVKDVKLESLRANVSIALQENLLFATTIRENIRYAVPDADDERVKAAARVACADEFIEGLPQGYDSELGERGGKLSTGQRQRLSIARAVVKDAPITVLDEPTAALDAEIELAVLRNLKRWGRNRVVVIITHRLSTIRNADHIVFMDEGRIVESGAHDDLMANDGRYRRLVGTELTAAGAS